MISTNEILGSHPIDLLKKLDTLIPGDWYPWEPEVLLHTIGEGLTPQAADKVLAVQAVAGHTDNVFKSAPMFENVIHAFCNNGIAPDTLQPVLVEEIMYAAPHILEIAKYVHEGSADTDFSPEIAQYVAAVAVYRGWVVLPDRLSFAQGTLDRLTGLHEGTDKYTEFGHAIALVKTLHSGVHTADIADYKSIIDTLDEDTSNAQTVKKVIGAYLYDPTILYGNKGNNA